ncbi:hypothetical protein Taro_014791, partial [Colocasia esculenta]|nr:hypothetical protein [Colocasia esculenta]
MKSFREGVGSFAEPSAIAGRDRIDGDPMVAWVARATTERGEYKLDEEAGDPEDPPRPNTFLTRAIEAAEEEERGDGDVGGGRQPHSSQFRAAEKDEVDLLGDLSIRAEGGANVDDDVQFERLMLGPTARSQSMREAPAIASSHTQSAAPSQAVKGTAVATSQPTKGKGKDIDLEILDPNAEETPPKDSSRLPSSRSHDSMTTGSPGGSIEGGDGDGGRDGGNDGDGGGDGGESGQGGGGGDGIQFTAEQHYGGHYTQDTDHGGPMQYNRRWKFVKGGRAEGSAVNSDSYNTMISDFERMSTHEFVGSYGGYSYQPESSNTDYFSGYATTGYPAPYFHPPSSIHVHVHVPVQQIYAPVEDVQMASLRIVHPRCEVWDHFVREFQSRYYTMITWDEFRTFVSQTKSYHLIGELPSESDESVQPQWGTYDPYQQGYWGY